MKRREMFVAAVATASMQVQGQAPAASGDLVELARRTMKSNREAIDKVKLPMAVEPAFSFKA